MVEAYGEWGALVVVVLGEGDNALVVVGHYLFEMFNEEMKVLK